MSFNRDDLLNKISLLKYIFASKNLIAAYFHVHKFLIRVRTGHGKPGKSWNFIISFSRPGKS